MGFRLDNLTFQPWPDHVEIAGRKIGAGEPCYVIAEAGSNHGRDLATALSLVDAAADAGCDAVKFQTFSGPDIAADFVNEETRPGPSVRRWGDKLLDIYSRWALPDAFHEPLAARAEERGIHFFSSAFSEAAVDRLAKLGVPAIKIASFELVHLPLIRHAAATGLPLILSTGMAGMGEIERALNAVVAGGGKQVVLLHCGSSYPLAEAGANLRAMATLRAAFGLPVGYSDHTTGLGVPTAAAALGAAVLEKHFTLGRDREGPDHSFAIEPHELTDMVKLMRQAEAGLGSSRKFRLPEEQGASRRGRRSIFAAQAIAAGERISLDKLKLVRPGIGLEPVFLELILGRPVTKAIAADQPLTWDHFMADAQ
jgi:sialic acid synthase SpsE